MKRRISLVMPAYNEEETIEDTIKGFKLIPEVKEIVVVDNNSTDRTAEIARKLGARVVRESKQGYGYACQKALREGKEDLILLTESDSTFRPKDTYKFLAYIDDADMVLGTRTCKQMVEPGAKMGWFLRLGNIFISKLLEIVFYRQQTRLTDVGCTYRMIKRKALKKIQNRFTVGGNYFSPEMIIESLVSGLKIVEIPVYYGKRRGESKITTNPWKSFKVGLNMIFLIIKKRLKYAF